MAGTIKSTVKIKNAKELQELIEIASDLANQLKETLQQIEHFKLKS